MVILILYALLSIICWSDGWLVYGWQSSLDVRGSPRSGGGWQLKLYAKVNSPKSSTKKVDDDDDDPLVYYPGRLVKASSHSLYPRNSWKDDDDDDEEGNGEEKEEVDVMYRLGEVVRCPDSGILLYDTSVGLSPYKYLPHDQQSVIDQLGRTWKSASDLQLVGLYRNDLPTDLSNLTTTIQITSNNTTIQVPLPWDSSSTTSMNYYQLPPQDDDEQQLPRRQQQRQQETAKINQSHVGTTIVPSNKLRKRSSSSDNTNKESKGSRFELDDERWLSHYNNLVQFKSIYGHLNIPKNYEEDPTLGRWVNRQRSYYATYVRNNYYTHNYTVVNNTDIVFGKKLIPLTQWRIQMLYDLGFSFSNDNKVSWIERYQQLKEQIQQQNPTSKNNNNNIDPNTKLYEWMTKQRTEYRKETLSPEQIKLLNSINFDWDPQQTAWETRIQQLKNKQSNNNSDNNIDNSIHQQNFENEDDDASLSQWLTEQRYQYKIYMSEHSWESTLTPERIQQLNDLNMDWNPKQSQWESKLQQYQQTFKQDNNITPTASKIDPSLKYWIQTQQREYKENTLSKEKEQDLIKIGFSFQGIQDQTFEENLQQFVQLQQEGTKITKSTHPQIWNFIDRQRQLYKTNQLSQDRYEQLNSVGFIFSAQESSWEQQYMKLKTFYKENGHSSPSSTFDENDEDDKSLYLFVRKQRDNYKRNKLHPHRQKKLESINFVWNAKEALWDTRFQELQSYHKQYGNCKIKAKENPQLYAWVRKQKLQYKYYTMNQQQTESDKTNTNSKKTTIQKTTMTPQRIERLNTLDFPW